MLSKYLIINHMGCHTWFKVPSKCTLDELRDLWLKNSAANIILTEDLLFNKIDTEELYLRDQLIRSINNYYKGDTEFYLNILRRKHRMVENKTIKFAFINHLYTIDDNYKGEDGWEYVNDTIYCETEDCPHDIFRRYGYPDHKLFSLEETLKYINDPENKCEIFDWSEQALKDFYNTYPNGYISFG